MKTPLGDFKYNLWQFLLAAFPITFCKEFTGEQLHFIFLIQSAMLSGGQLDIEMGRGSGKTSIIECAAIWGLLYEHSYYTVIVGRRLNDDAIDILKSIVLHVKYNKNLYMMNKDLFLRISGKGCIQLNDRFIEGKGINCFFAGMHKHADDGQVIRPDFVFIDDIACLSLSPVRKAKYEKVLQEQVFALGGPNSPISAISTKTRGH